MGIEKLKTRLEEIERRRDSGKKRIIVSFPDDGIPDRWHYPGRPGFPIPESERTIRPGDIRISVHRIDHLPGIPPTTDVNDSVALPTEGQAAPDPPTEGQAAPENRPPEGGQPFLPVASMLDVAVFHEEPAPAKTEPEPAPSRWFVRR